MIDPATVAWSCVVDDTPAIWASLIPWLATAIELAAIAPARLFVHHVCPLRPEIAALCARLGIHTRVVDVFDRDFPHANKIRQCAADFGDAAHVVLTDVDIAFASPPPLDRIGAPVAGKAVDLENPPIEILRRVFGVAGMPMPAPWHPVFLGNDDARAEFETFRGNCNGGLLVVDRAVLAPLGRAWSRWARWLIERIDLLERWRVHADQVSFCLAVNDLGVDVERLEDGWNYPLGVRLPADGLDPVLLHHHAALDSKGLLRPGRTERSRAAIARVNDAIAAFHARYPIGGPV